MQLFIYFWLLVLSNLSGCMIIPLAPRTMTANFDQTEIISGEPFKAFSTIDSLGRNIHFYVSSSSLNRLPLFLFVAGSGCESNFWKKPDGSISNGHQGLLLKSIASHAHVMVVEKPGVNLFDSTSNPGTANDCSEEFKDQHTLDRWALALSAAVDASIRLNHIQPDKIVAIGHSEGAISIAKLATINPRITHVALLSGNGASQLFEIVVNRSTAEITQVYKDFDFITNHPDDIQTMFWGHPSKRWASFMRESMPDLLLNTKAKIFLAHGEFDTATPIQSFDFLVSDLKRRGKHFEFERIEKANHSLNLPTDAPGDGMKKIFKKILNWSEK